MRIGELLVKSGMITEEQLTEALKIQQTNKKKLGEILIELGYITSRELIWLLSEQASIPFIELKPEILNSKLIRSFSEKLLYECCVIPLYEIEGKLYVATGNPTDPGLIKKIEEIVKKEVVLAAAEPAKIFQLLDRFFLVEQTEPIIEGAELETNINIEIVDNQAIIEFIDEKGNVTRQKAKAHISVKIDKLLKPEKL